MLTWETLCRDWMASFNNRNPDILLPHLDEGFRWPTSQNAKDQGKSEGLKYADMKEWALTAQIADGVYESTIHNGEDVLIGTHFVTRKGDRYKVMGVAKIKDGKVYEYHHTMSPL